VEALSLLFPSIDRKPSWRSWERLMAQTSLHESMLKTFSNVPSGAFPPLGHLDIPAYWLNSMPRVTWASLSILLVLHHSRHQIANRSLCLGVEILQVGRHSGKWSSSPIGSARRSALHVSVSAEAKPLSESRGTEKACRSCKSDRLCCNAFLGRE